MRCVGRTDDMLIVRGVNVFPSASVELALDATADAALAEAIRDRVRNVLVVQTQIELVPFGSLRRSDYKSKPVEYPAEVVD